LQPFLVNRSRKKPLNSAVSGAVDMAVIRIRVYIRVPSWRVVWADVAGRVRGERRAVKTG
jgi:hypothetical protein